MLCFVAIGYIYWLIDTVLRLAFNSRTVLGKKLLWYADVLAYNIVRGSPFAAALVVGMFVALVSITSSYALINELWFFSFAKSLSRRECLVFPRLAAWVSRFKPSSADVMLSLSLSLEINLTALLSITTTTTNNNNNKCEVENSYSQSPLQSVCHQSLIAKVCYD